MKKAFILVLVLLFVGRINCYAMDRIKITQDVQNAINMYKRHNYSACIQGMQKVIDQQKMQDLSIAYYYLGNSYVKLGRSDRAIESYNQVITLNTSPGLVKYAQQGVECLKNIDSCKDPDNLNGFVRSGLKMHPKIYYDLQAKEVETVQTDMNQNSGKDQSVNFNKYKYINDASQEMPSDKEIADAVKTLAKVGFAPYGTNFNNQNLAQLNMLLGQNGYNNYNNMLPYLMAQNNNSENNEATKKQIMQLMMMNQMPSGF